MRRVLVVDDDPAGLDLRKLILERRGYEVWTASNADDARILFETIHPEIAILDLRLPEVEDGLSLIRDFHSSTRIIVLSGDSTAIEGRLEASMVHAIFGKPVRLERLVEALGPLTGVPGSASTQNLRE
jgi:two-component system response regulator RegA